MLEGGGGGEGAKLCLSKTVRHSSIVPLLVLQLVLPTGGAAPSSQVVAMMPLLLLLPVVVVVRRRRRERQVPLVKLISDARSTCRRMRSTMSSHKLSKSIYSMFAAVVVFVNGSIRAIHTS